MLSVVEECMDIEEKTEISLEQGEDFPEEDSSDRTPFSLDMLPSNNSFSFYKYSCPILTYHSVNYSYIFTNIPFSPPKMIV